MKSKSNPIKQVVSQNSDGKNPMPRRMYKNDFLRRLVLISGGASGLQIWDRLVFITNIDVEN